jgi:hypothetical protein
MAFVHIIKRTSQAVFLTCQLSSKRSKEIISVKLAQELQEAITSLSKFSIHYLYSCEMIARYPTFIEAKKMFVDALKIIERLTFLIDKIVTCKDPDEYFAELTDKQKKIVMETTFLQLLEKIQAKPMSEHYKASKESCDDLVDNFIYAAKNEISRWDSTVATMENLGMKSLLHEISDSLLENLDGLRATVDQASTNYNETKLNHNSRVYISMAESCVLSMAAGVKAANIGELYILFGELSDISMIASTVGRLFESIVQRKTDQVENLRDRFITQAGRLNDLVMSAFEQLDVSHNLYCQAKALKDRVKDGSQIAVNGIMLLLEFPREDHAVDLAASSIKSFSETVKELRKLVLGQEGIYTTSELLQGASNILLILNPCCKIRAMKVKRDRLIMSNKR